MTNDAIMHDESSTESEFFDSGDENTFKTSSSAREKEFYQSNATFAASVAHVEPKKDPTEGTARAQQEATEENTQPVLESEQPRQVVTLSADNHSLSLPSLTMFGTTTTMESSFPSDSTNSTQPAPRAPPLSVVAVPLRAPPMVEAPPSTQVPQPVEPPSISCIKCRRSLSTDSYPIAAPGHGSCVCCGRFYLESKLMTHEDNQYCGECLPSSDACRRCGRAFISLPSVAPDAAIKCSCCEQLLPRNAFSNTQRRKPDENRRCKVCIGTLSQSIMDRTARSDWVPKTLRSTWNTGPSEMEVKITKIKLERRALQRKHDANDLVGATRLEYQAELAKQESKLDQQAATLRRSDPALYDELNATIKIKTANAVPRSERDSMQDKKGLKKMQKREEEREKKKTEKKKRKREEFHAKRRAAKAAKAATNAVSTVSDGTTEAEGDSATR
ncbi:hypothetical protein Poli38472_013265 [Pythium oligandrum]|uniref:Uncharacterized protein n=1 Tax=Pythium oligandrum TaxID=41045 RepID=A0A8K1C2P3_PYTOL|nr:hypothetical protein Poli38472_013265 [Pythium oligandrum]|eukprot:TMW55374.1 hypothetical protein Poli38472_013265 [Pythium oligandrum]